MPRISLDVTEGTFARIGEICKEEYWSKESYLRRFIDKDFEERKERGEGEALNEKR